MTEMPDQIIVPVMFEHQRTLPQWEYMVLATSDAMQLGRLGLDGWQVSCSFYDPNLPLQQFLLIREILPPVEETAEEEAEREKRERYANMSKEELDARHKKAFDDMEIEAKRLRELRDE